MTQLIARYPKQSTPIRENEITEKSDSSSSRNAATCKTHSNPFLRKLATPANYLRCVEWPI